MRIKSSVTNGTLGINNFDSQGNAAASAVFAEPRWTPEKYGQVYLPGVGETEAVNREDSCSNRITRNQQTS